VDYDEENHAEFVVKRKQALVTLLSTAPYISLDNQYPSVRTSTGPLAGEIVVDVSVEVAKKRMGEKGPELEGQQHPPIRFTTFLFMFAWIFSFS
jgi:hypothetical protein